MMCHLCSIGGRSGELAGQRNTLTPYRACWDITGYERARYPIGKHLFNDIYKWQRNSLNRQIVAISL
ncbi:hypothetical protein TNCV_2020641 [Trichonephila clavipes]|nr:hypothetical protein TNCV_2020641 [Trichonephila clavipes]